MTGLDTQTRIPQIQMVGLPRVAKGVRRWLRAYRLMMRWEFTSLRMAIPVMAAVQLLAGAGMAIGIGLFRDVPERDGMFLATGAAVISLVLVGLVLGPQIVSGQKAEKSYDFLFSLPLPRSAAAAAWTSVSILISVPGMVAALACAAWRYDLKFHIGWSLPVAVLMVAVTANAIGYALGHAIPNPMITAMATQVIVFILVGFAPVSFPPERLPRWLDRLHDWLPVEPMANVVRGSLAPELVTNLGRSYLVLGAWLAGMLAISAAVVGRRR